MRCLILCLLMCSAASASPVDVLDRFVQTGTMDTGRVGILDELEGLPAVDLIFGYALARWDQGPLDFGTRARIDRLIQYASRLSRTDHRPFFTHEIKKKADRLLVYYSARSHTQGDLLSVFDSMRLWTSENFWFVLKSAGSTAGLADGARRLRLVIPSLNDEQLATLSATIRKIRPYSLVQLSLLMDAGTLTESELVILFKMAAQRFVEAQGPSLDYSMAQHRRGEASDRVFAETFDRIRRAIGSKDPNVLSALGKARAYWEGKPNSPTKGSHMRFFDSILNERMTWVDRDTWVPKAEPVRLPQITSVDGNVILANFRIKKPCADDVN